jgi:nitrogen fixation/metabolism regulation signal transduction histidine kinase
VLSNLPCGVLVFGTNGLIKTANPAAKQILGFASASGMSANDIFRGAVVTRARLSSTGSAAQRTPAEPVRLADEVSSVLREGSNKRELEAEYKTPGGTKRFLAVTISKICADDGPLGVACLIDDLSELEQIRQQQELHGEISAEMALQLRTSLATISGYAQQLSATRDSDSAKQIATDIALEAAQLERSIGGFLRKKETRTAANA